MQSVAATTNADEQEAMAQRAAQFRSNGSAVGLVAAGAMRKEGITPDPLQMNTPPKQPVAHRPPAPAWPMSCNLLLLAQFLERLSLAHLKGVFTPFLVQNVGIQPEVANTCLQLLIQVGFFAPIVGAVLADAKYGKYGALSSLFPVYLFGEFLLATSPILPAPKFIHPYIEFVGIFFLAYSCGCTRAVMPAYGAEQIWPPNVPQLGCFFALFYAQEHLAIVWCAQLLPFLKSMSPIWPLSANKPLVGVLLCALTFLCFAFAILVGTNSMFRQSLPQGQVNVFSRSWHTIRHAFRNKWRQRQRRLVNAATTAARAKREAVGMPAEPTDLLDHFLDDHNCERDKECDFGRKQVCGQAKFLLELKCALRILLLLLPLSLFWAFHSQLQSIWAVQAQSVDPLLPFVGWTLTPERLALLPNLLVLFWICTFYMSVFPSSALSKCFFLNSFVPIFLQNNAGFPFGFSSYLRRMCVGIFLCAFAVAMSISVQMRLNASPSPPIQPLPDSATLKLFNTFPAGECTIFVSRIGVNGQRAAVDEMGWSGELKVLPAQNDSSNSIIAGLPALPLSEADVAAGFVDWQFRFDGINCASHRKSGLRIWIKPGKLNVAAIGPHGILWAPVDVPSRPASGSGQSILGLVVQLPCNSLTDSMSSSLSECVNSTNDDQPFAALTPFASGISLCSAIPLNTSITTTTASSNSCLQNWSVDELVATQLFVFPPRGDNLGMGKASLYPPKMVTAGNYKLVLQPSMATKGGNSLSSQENGTSESSSNDSLLYQQQWDNVVVSDSGGIFLAVIALDGSPLAGQNDSISARPKPIQSMLLLAEPASVGIVWLFPQQMLMAASEVLIGVSGLEFCYVQAPNALRTTMIGYWYLLVYLGVAMLAPQLSKLHQAAGIANSLFWQLFSISSCLFVIGTLFALFANFSFKYRDNISVVAAGITSVQQAGSANANQPRRKQAEVAGDGGGLAVKLGDALRASMARLPTKRVIRL